MFYQLKNSTGRYNFECVRYNDFNFAPHMHRHIELIYVSDGEIELFCDGKQAVICAGEYGFVPSNHIHSYNTSEHSVVYVCVASEDFIPFFVKETASKKASDIKFTCRKSVSDFVRVELFVTDRTPDVYIIKSALYAIVGEMLREIKFLPVGGKNEKVTDRLIRYITENFTDDITLKSAAKELGYDEHYLSRCFHSAIPIHFSKYVNMLRFDEACRLLQHTDLSVSEIALQSGFQSLRTFNRVFRELSGNAPRDAFKSDCQKRCIP